MDDNSSGIPRGYSSKGYAFSGKVMLCATVILFTVIVLIVCLHIYARWFLLRTRRRNLRRSRNLIFYTDAVSVASRGLDASVLQSLPVFVYSTKTHNEVTECAVCLSEFEENEKGRLLPKCNHSFHIDCIDMWFHSHSTCPLCRDPVNPEITVPVTESPGPGDVVITVGESEEAEPSSGLCPSCQHGENETARFSSQWVASSSSLGPRRKPLEMVGISIEVPRRNEDFRSLEEEQRLGGSPGVQGFKSPGVQGFKSPGSRMLSLKRILGIDRRDGISPSSANTNDATNLEGGEDAQPDGAQAQAQSLSLR
ncbi:hypothetical protein HHK36_020812 [Tetracentron sinense]|uniref:RING-type E3 ubiquitin transferase n=1 Tax=Tetracentron sinense TaxID=13715 RepID=A0A834YYC0_TETSI|nr:hypothetical protein HHK36_020812 [Tetracentron sinense]